MGYSVEAINNEEDGAKKRTALQEQILKMNQLRDGKNQKDGMKVETPEAISQPESKSDSVEISSQGQKALEQLLEKNNDGKKKKQNADESENGDEKKKANNPNLHTLSRKQLNSLVSQGIISREDMKQELKRRSALSFPPETIDQV